MPAKIKIAILCLVTANIIWGFSYPLYKWSLENVPPFTFAFLRFFLASFLILPFIRHSLTIEKKDIKYLVLLSLFGITFGISLLFLGLQHSTSINAPIVSATGPIFLLISSLLFLHEKPQKRVIFGTCISLAGVITLVLGPIFASGLEGSIYGNLLLIFSTIGGILHTILLKKIIDRNNHLTITFWSFVIGSLPLLPLVVYESVQQGGFLIHLNSHGVIGILFGVIFASAIAHTVNSLGIKNMKTSEVGVFSYIAPIATILLAVPLLGEKITPLYIFCSLLVFLGIFISEERFHWRIWQKFHKSI
ncbi:DMT family transporter [soil metagenome]